MTKLRAGFAARDITPDWSVWLAGFALRTEPSDGVAHPLHVRVALLETTGDTPADRSRVLIASADLLNWGPERLPELRELLSREVDVDPDRILFAATHTHSGPQTNGWHARATGILDPRFLDLLGDRLVDAAREAAGRLEPVSMSRAETRHELAMYRRTVVDGRAVARPNPDGPTDPRLTVLAYRRPDGSLAGTLTHYTCHPVISAAQQLSGDFTGVAMTRLGESNGAVNLYLQGCCGDQNPGRLACAGLEEVERQAGHFVASIQAALAGPAVDLAPAPLSARWAVAELPFDHRPTRAEIEAACGADGVLGEWGRAFRDHPERIADSATFHAQRLDLAAGQSLLAMNGEVTVGYGLAIRSESGGTVLPVGYSNGMIGYLPSAEQIRDGGYEADESTRYYLLPGRFSPAIEAVITETARGLIHRR